MDHVHSRADADRGCMWRLQVILLKDIPGTGSKGELARVNNGYLRNYLMPQQLAVPATAGILQCASCCRRPLAPHQHQSRDRQPLSMPIVAASLHAFRSEVCACEARLRASLQFGITGRYRRRTRQSSGRPWRSSPRRRPWPLRWPPLANLSSGRRCAPYDVRATPRVHEHATGSPRGS